MQHSTLTQPIITMPKDDGISQIAISEPQSLASEGQGRGGQNLTFGGQEDNKFYHQVIKREAIYSTMGIKSAAVYQNYHKFEQQYRFRKIDLRM